VKYNLSLETEITRKSSSQSQVSLPGFVQKNKVNCKWSLTCRKSSYNARGGQVHPYTLDALLQECRCWKGTHKMNFKLLNDRTGTLLCYYCEITHLLNVYKCMSPIYLICSMLLWICSVIDAWQHEIYLFYIIKKQNTTEKASSFQNL